MHWAEITCALQMKGHTLTSFAKKFGHKRSLVSMVIRGQRTSHPVAYDIAAITGIPTEKMWPGKYLTAPAYKKARGDNRTGRLPELKEVANG